MTDDELRHLVRTAIAQHAAGQPLTSDMPSHSSHGRFTLLPVGSDRDGRCLIEPTVLCNHCGYCQSFGH